MLRLNDDCLYEIFSLLTIKEQLIVAQVSLRFHELILDMFWNKQFQEIDTESSLLKAFNSEEFQQFFRLISGNLRKLRVADTKHSAFSSYLGRYRFRPEIAFYFSLNFELLTSLEIDDRRMHDGYLRLVAQQCPSLHALSVSSEYITGEHIVDIKKLHLLNAPHCSLSPANLYIILKTLKLTHLNVSGNLLDLVSTVLECMHLEDLEVLQIDDKSIGLLLAEHLTMPPNRLRELHITNCQNTHELNVALGRTLKDLKFPKFLNTFSSDVPFLGCFMAEALERAPLKHLELHADNDVTICCRLLQHCQHLQYIKVQLDAPHLTLLLKRLDEFLVQEKDNERTTIQLFLNIAPSDFETIRRIQRWTTVSVHYRQQQLLNISINHELELRDKNSFIYYAFDVLKLEHKIEKSV